MTRDTSRGYSDDEIALMEKWLREGLSAGQMADQLTRERGRAVTRNAIIGVVTRNAVLKAIGFGRTPAVRAEPAKAKRPSAPSPRPTERPSAPSRQSPLPRLAPTAFDANALRVTLADLPPRGCRFAVNDAAVGEDHLFCGLPAATDLPYCAHHADRAYSGLPQRRAA